MCQEAVQSILIFSFNAGYPWRIESTLRGTRGSICPRRATTSFVLCLLFFFFRMKNSTLSNEDRGRVSKAMRSEVAHAKMRNGWIITSDKDDVTFLLGYCHFFWLCSEGVGGNGEQRAGGVGERGGGFIILCWGVFFYPDIDYLFLEIISASTLPAFTPSRSVRMFPP